MPDFTILLTHIETCINSHPLTPISEEHPDYISLTPAHFLVGDTRKLLGKLNLPEPKLKFLPMTHLHQ